MTSIKLWANSLGEDKAQAKYAMNPRPRESD